MCMVWIFSVSGKLPGSEKRDGDSENHDDENIPTGDEGGDGGRVGDDDDDFEAGGGEVESIVPSFANTFLSITTKPMRLFPTTSSTNNTNTTTTTSY